MRTSGTGNRPENADTADAAFSIHVWICARVGVFAPRSIHRSIAPPPIDSLLLSTASAASVAATSIDDNARTQSERASGTAQVWHRPRGNAGCPNFAEMRNKLM